MCFMQLPKHNMFRKEAANPLSSPPEKMALCQANEKEIERWLRARMRRNENAVIVQKELSKKEAVGK